MAGVLAFSGFVPTVAGWRAELRGPHRDPRLRRSRHPGPGDRDRLRPSRPRPARRAAGSTSPTASPTWSTRSTPAAVPVAAEWLAATLPGSRGLGDVVVGARGKGRKASRRARPSRRRPWLAVAARREGGSAGSDESGRRLRVTRGAREGLGRATRPAGRDGERGKSTLPCVLGNSHGRTAWIWSPIEGVAQSLGDRAAPRRRPRSGVERPASPRREREAVPVELQEVVGGGD